MNNKQLLIYIDSEISKLKVLIQAFNYDINSHVVIGALASITTLEELKILSTISKSN